MLSNIENTQFDISIEEAATLVATSVYNIVPITFAFCHEMPLYGLTSIGTATCSILYWIHPTHGWRRNLDLFYAKFTFAVYFGSGIWYVPYGYPMMILYTGA